MLTNNSTLVIYKNYLIKFDKFLTINAIAYRDYIHEYNIIVTRGKQARIIYR